MYSETLAIKGSESLGFDFGAKKCENHRVGGYGTTLNHVAANVPIHPPTKPVECDWS
ncbi:MAG: hypothetical protein JSS40_14295 [Proteobacteria bacterium]|nr:hypothetical protein [Pseudomonadota bacterium]